MKKLSFILMALLNWANSIANDEFPTINDHWLRAAPPNAKMLAAYGQLINKTENNTTLIGAFSPDFGRVEIHKTEITEGVARMIHQPQLTLTSQQSLDFTPGGLHIMLMHPRKQITIGDSIKICLIYQNGDEQNVQHINFPVIEK